MLSGHGTIVSPVVCVFVCVCAVLVCCVFCVLLVLSGQCKMNLLDSNPLSVYGTVGDRSGDNIGVVWWRMCMSKQCQREVYVPLINCATTSHALGHPCLVSLLFMASHIPHFLICRIFYLLVSFPFFIAFTCIV